MKDSNMNNELKCPWCDELMVPEVSTMYAGDRAVQERKCSTCGKLLSAYLKEAGRFLKKVRTFPDYEV
jgi:phage FluMu protein Com